MSRLTDERAAKGWTYRIGGFRNRHSGYTVVRKMDWTDEAAEPEWWVQDVNNRVVATCLYCDEALDLAEATHELSVQGDTNDLQYT